ncbi:MAG TPA: RDD family protein [Candidatus Competibacteraceae bacterium]|nr:RDD family protein [Candidatus Competibacteraceae bacterium]
MAPPLPGIARRLASMLYESLVVFAVLLIGFLLPQILLSAYGLGTSNRLLWLHVLALLALYFVWFWLHGGQTLPMKTWKLRLASTDGSALRPLQAILRYLAAWPSVLFFGIGIVWALVDKDRQFLHDRIAGTRIVATDLQ